MILNAFPTIKRWWDDHKIEKPVFYHDHEAKGKASTAMGESSKSSIWSEMWSIIGLLDVTGICLMANHYTQSRKNNTWKYILSIVGIIAFIVCFSFVASEVLFCGVTKFVSSSVVICMVSSLSLSLLLWIVMLKRRTQFANLIDKSGTLCELIQGNKDTKLLLYNRIACLYVFFAPIVASLCCVLSIQNDDTYFYLHCYLYGHQLLDTINDYWKSILLLFFLVVENYMQLFLPNLVTILIFFLSEHLSAVILAFVHKCTTETWWGHCTVHREVKSLKMLQFYKKIKRNFDLMHDLSSLPIFLVLSQKFLTLFFTLTVILSSKKKKVLIQLIEGYFLAFNALISLILLILAGSRIKESHSKIRSLLLDMSEFQDYHSGPLRYDFLSLLKTFAEKEDMILSAARMIPLTRSLFLKIGAALVTYGVLIVQLDSSGDA